MNEKEINKIIAEYMGTCCDYGNSYTDSLDACVPVVERLELEEICYFKTPDFWICRLKGEISTLEETRSLALATALATCIKEIR